MTTQLTNDQKHRYQVFKRYRNQYDALRKIRDTFWQRLTDQPPEWAANISTRFKQDYREQISISYSVDGHAPEIESESLLLDPYNFVWIDHPWKMPTTDLICDYSRYTDLNSINLSLMLRLIYQEENYSYGDHEDHTQFNLGISQSIDHPTNVNFINFEMEQPVSTDQINEFVDNCESAIKKEQILASGTTIKREHGMSTKKSNLNDEEKAAIMSLTKESVGKAFFSRLGFTDEAKSLCQSLNIRMVLPEEISNDIKKWIDKDNK